MHRAMQPAATVEQYVELDGNDIWGLNYPKASSFVKRLLDLASAATFEAFYKDVWVTWRGNSPVAQDGTPLDPAGMSAIVDRALSAHYGVDFATFRSALAGIIATRLEQPKPIAADDRAAIEAMFAARDAAISEGDEKAYRATMEGFYCDSPSSEDERTKTAAAEATGQPTRSTLEEIIDLDIVNYPTVEVTFKKRIAWLERFPIGWRFEGVR